LRLVTEDFYTYLSELLPAAYCLGVSILIFVSQSVEKFKDQLNFRRVDTRVHP
jgi:hypothetical protein